MNEFDVFPIFEWWTFPAWKIHSFRSPRSTYLSCGAERLDGFKEPGCGENKWMARIAEGMLKGRDSNVDLFFSHPFFFSTDHLISDISSTARQHPHPGFPIISTPQARESSLETLQVPRAELVGGTHAMKNPRRLPDKCLIPDDFPLPC